MSRLICLITTSLLFRSSFILATAIFAEVLLQNITHKTQPIYTSTHTHTQRRGEERREKDAPFGGVKAAAEEGETHGGGLLPAVGGGGSHYHLLSFEKKKCSFFVIKRMEGQSVKKSALSTGHNGRIERNFFIYLK